MTQADYINENKDRFLNELLELLKIPSVSARSEHNADMKKCADAVAQKLRDAGADKVEIVPTAGHPVIYGEKIADPKLKTVLVYGHYDVQPPDPLELWKSPPFEPVIKDGKIFARGACDDKGQMYMHVKAFETMMKTNTLACNVKFMIEGEEEVGSANLGTFVKENKDKLKADVILISDTSMISLDTPSIDVGLRGLTYMEVEVVGPNRDLHSGVYGGAVANPATVLCKMIAAMHDENNHITIPGFYDDVQELTDQERKDLNAQPFNQEEYNADLGIAKEWGEKGYTNIERTGTRPTLEINGIWSGYTGEGAKTVLPSKANAKISMRLVPNQKSGKIEELFTNYFKKEAPPYVTVSVKAHHGGEPYITPPGSLGFQAASKAIEKTFGKTPIPTRSGGSIPIVALFEKELGLKSLLLGFGLDSDNLHSPNEKFDIANFYKGIETIPYFFKYYAELSST
jgi:acetylornithine deacetylase/succinyl-diaminopimelate desuccinylase-like protein